MVLPTPCRFVNGAASRIPCPSGRRQQYADTGGFTDHVFAVTALLGYQFILRIRDLPSKRLHVFDPGAVPSELRGLIGSKVRNSLIVEN